MTHAPTHDLFPLVIAAASADPPSHWPDQLLALLNPDLIASPPAASDTDDILPILNTLRRDPHTVPEAADWFTRRGDTGTADDLRRWLATNAFAGVRDAGLALLRHLVTVSRPVRHAVGSEALSRFSHDEIASRVDEVLRETHPQLHGTSPATWIRVRVAAGSHSVWTGTGVRLKPFSVQVAKPGLRAISGHPVEAVVAVWAGRWWWRRVVSAVEPRHVCPLVQGLWQPGVTGGSGRTGA